MKKAFSIFKRDLMIISKDIMGLYVLIAPIILAFVILAFAPGISDSFLNVAVDNSVDKDFISVIREYAGVEKFNSIEELEERVNKRDEVIGITNINKKLEIVVSGDESQRTIDTAKLFISMNNLNIQNNNKSNLKIYTFPERIPKITQALSISLIFIIVILASMVISFTLVEEKVDGTIKAANVTPIGHVNYILSKSIIGVFSVILNTAACIIILGLTDINLIQLSLILILCSLISIVVGVAISLISKDFIEASGSIKILMIPAIIATLVYELAPGKWQWTMMWNPFYWAHRAISEIINKTIFWSDIILYSIAIFIWLIIVSLICIKSIRKSLR